MGGGFCHQHPRRHVVLGRDVYRHVLEFSALRILFEEASHKAQYGFGTVLLKAIFGGWLVALIALLVAASQDTISQVFFVFSLTFLIPAAGLTHCIAGTSEFLISVFSGEESWAEYFGGFLLPTTLGNIVGGVVLVTLLNYGQVMGSRAKTVLWGVTDRRDQRGSKAGLEFRDMRTCELLRIILPRTPVNKG